MIILLFLLGIFFIRRVQPIMMVGSLIIITLFYSYIIYKIIERYWFRYALVIVILRGVLVVFTYMVSLIPNERFENYNLILLFFVIFVVTIGIIFNLIGDISYISLVLWISYVRIYNLFIVGFLFSIMLVVVWLRCINEGAVRISY